MLTFSNYYLVELLEQFNQLAMKICDTCFQTENPRIPYTEIELFLTDSKKARLLGLNIILNLFPTPPRLLGKISNGEQIVF